MPTRTVTWYWKDSGFAREDIFEGRTRATAGSLPDVLNLAQGATDSASFACEMVPHTLGDISFTPVDPVASVPSHTFPDSGSFSGSVTYPDAWEGARIFLAYQFPSGSTLGFGNVAFVFATPIINRIAVTRDGNDFTFSATNVTHGQTNAGVNGGFFDSQPDAPLYIASIRYEIDGTVTDVPYGTPFHWTATDSTHSAVRARPVANDGTLGAWFYLNIAPVAVFSVSDDGITAEVDSAASFAPNGTLHSREWNVYANGAYSTEGIGVQGATATEIDLMNYTSGEVLEIQLEVRATLTDASGATFLYPATFNAAGYSALLSHYTRRNATPIGGACGLLQHRMGPLLTANNEGTGVRVIAKPSNSTALLEGLQSPSLYHIGNPKHGGTIGLCAQKRSDKTWWIYHSANAGQTWNEVRMALDSTYTSVVPCGTLEGAELEAGIRKSDKALVVQRTVKGVTKPLVPVVTLEKIAPIQLRQKTPVDSTVLVLFVAPVTGQSRMVYESTNGGDTWEVAS
jgi:hypothetical protein